MTNFGTRARQIMPLIVPPSGISNDWSDVIKVDKFGANHQITMASDPEDCWDYGGTYTFLTSAATLYASSDDTNDDQVILVEGLDANWAIQTATVTLNGQTQMEIGSGLTWLRVYRAYNTSATATAGNVYIAESDDLTGGAPDTASKVKAYIQQDDQQTMMAIYTVPAGYTAYLFRWYCSVAVGPSGNAIIELQVRSQGGVFRVQRHIGISDSGTSAFSEFLPIANAYSAMTDIKVVIEEVNVNDMDIAGGFDILLVSNG